DRLVGAVVAAAQRGGEPVVVVAVPGEPLGFLAQVARRAGVVPVPADPGDRPARGLHLEPAVDVAEVARGLVPPAHAPLPDLDLPVYLQSCLIGLTGQDRGRASPAGRARVLQRGCRWAPQRWVPTPGSAGPAA